MRFCAVYKIYLRKYSKEKFACLLFDILPLENAHFTCKVQFTTKGLTVLLITMVWPQSYHFVEIVRYRHSKELVTGTMDVVSYINLLFISALIPMSLFLNRLGLRACAYPNIISLAICCVSGLKEQRFHACIFHMPVFVWIAHTLYFDPL